MKVLILGGTGFLSRETARSFLRAGHDVTCAARGVSGTPPEGAVFVRWDRDEETPLEIPTPDVVIDVATNPDHVARALGQFPDARWIYVSTISVYPVVTQPAGTPETTPVCEPATSGGYGGLKVACENLVRASNHVIVRPGLIVGPGDPTGRFTYWPARIDRASADGMPYIAPGEGDEWVQWIDVRDLADWCVVLAGSTITGTFDAVAPAVTRDEFLIELSTIAHPTPVWLSAAELSRHEVSFWAGDRAIPLWIPVAEMAGLMARDHRPAESAGLRTRPLAVTARDTLSWHHAGGPAGGLTRAEELAVLAELGHITPGSQP